MDLLAGVRVLDLTTFLSGPFCTQLLGDLGAEIVKVEPPDGDSSRSIPPHFVGEDSAYFLSTNRNKRSVVVDLKHPAGIDAVRRLVDASDVVIENFRPGVCARLGLDPAELRARTPRLVWCSISGFGQTGPESQRPAYDMIVQALSGVMSLTGEPGRPSVRLGIPAGDLVAGLYAAIAIQAALHRRDRTGEGATLDVAMLDCQLAMLSYQAVYSMLSGTTPPPQGSAHDSIPTYRTFVAGDGRQFVVTANTERMWEGLCDAFDRRDLLDDGRFATLSSRLEHVRDLADTLETTVLGRPAAEWVDRLQARDVPVALIATVPDALEASRKSGREMVRELHGERGTVPVVALPIRVDGRPAEDGEYPPALGADTRAILAEVAGMAPGEIAELVSSGAVSDAGSGDGPT
ncbi:MAG TPA: CoA transferase [Acidimicrobiia bacterium]